MFGSATVTASDWLSVSVTGLVFASESRIESASGSQCVSGSVIASVFDSATELVFENKSEFDSTTASAFEFGSGSASWFASATDWGSE